MPTSTKSLKTLSEIKRYWAQNKIPHYFVGASAFNLIDMDRWIHRLSYIVYIPPDKKPRADVITPINTAAPVFDHYEQIPLYLLEHKQVLDFIKKDRKSAGKAAPKVLFLFFNEALEKRCHELKLEVAHPPFRLIKKWDHKINATRLGNEVGVPSVPNILVKVDSYGTLEKRAKQAKLGKQWVIQTPYGDSGKTTFFISSEADYNMYSRYIEKENCVKIMKRIRCASAAIEACATHRGTFTGPLMSELIGHPWLTPYSGGWCGNDLHPAGFSVTTRKTAQEMTVKLGNALYKKGYKGYFEVDYLIDLDHGNVYFGELNPRISGITPMTNNCAYAEETLPLFLIHLTEYAGIEFELDATAYNRDVLHRGAQGKSGQLIFKFVETDLKVVDHAPESGVYTLDTDGRLAWKNHAIHRHAARSENEAFLMQIKSKDEYVYHGEDMAILFINTPVMGKKGSLTHMARKWIKALRNAYILRPLTDEEQLIIDRYQNPGVRLKRTQADG